MLQNHFNAIKSNGLETYLEHLQLYVVSHNVRLIYEKTKYQGINKDVNVFWTA